jgi:teichuronic acid biosynthesis glycosyltransferase TuaC
VTQDRQLPPVLGQAQSKQTVRPLHVLTLTPFYPSENDDAAGCFVAEPLDALAKAGVANTVFAVQPAYRGRLRAREYGWRAEWLRYLSLPGGLGLPMAGAFLFARIVGRVRELQKLGPIDLIHAHGPLPCGHAALLLSMELGVPYVVSVHGLDAFSTKQVSGRAGEWCKRISQRAYRSSRRVICVSERVREQVLEGAGTSCQTSVVYNGVDPELFSPKIEPGTEPSDARPIILSVGNLIPIKGHDVLIRAVASLAAEFPVLTLEIIGDGPERGRLQALAQQLQIGDRVRFLGRRSRQQVASAMQQCAVFALPSRYEGLGCVYLEAMASGKPVIGCRGQGIEEVVEHGTNGWLVGIDDGKELRHALSTLLSNAALRKFVSGHARQTILDEFTLVRQADHLRRIYQECVE